MALMTLIILQNLNWLWHRLYDITVGGRAKSFQQSVKKWGKVE